MKTNELSELMKTYEMTYEHVIPKRLWIVVRLDGRGFTKFTKSSDRFEKPFDIRFHDAMLLTTEALMNSGLEVLLGYTQSDEISLVISPTDGTFGRRVIKILTVLSGEASAFFSVHFSEATVFDARVLALPDIESVSEYLFTRQEDAHRNALSAQAYWALRKEGLNGTQASKLLHGASVSEKNELLFKRGINFNETPPWQRRGSCVVWETYEKEGFNPLMEEKTMVERRRLSQVRDLSMKSEFQEQVVQWLSLSSD